MRRELGSTTYPRPPERPWLPATGRSRPGSNPWTRRRARPPCGNRAGSRVSARNCYAPSRTSVSVSARGSRALAALRAQPRAVQHAARVMRAASELNGVISGAEWLAAGRADHAHCGRTPPSPSGEERADSGALLRALGHARRRRDPTDPRPSAPDRPYMSYHITRAGWCDRVRMRHHTDRHGRRGPEIRDTRADRELGVVARPRRLGALPHRLAPARADDGHLVPGHGRRVHRGEQGGLGARRADPPLPRG